MKKVLTEYNKSVNIIVQRNRQTQEREEERMSNKEKTEKRVPLLTRTVTDSYTYNLYSLEDGTITALGEVTVPEKLKESDIKKIAKEHDVKKVIAEVTSTSERLLGITVDEFLKIAKPVENGKLVDAK